MTIAQEKRKIPHRDRKNPNMREQWEKQKKERNAAQRAKRQIS